MTPKVRPSEPTKSAQIARRLSLSNRRRVEKGANLRVAGKTVAHLSKRLLWAALIIGLVVGVSYGVGRAWEAAKESEYFAISNVEIEGNSRLSRDEILEAMHVDASQNLLRFDVDAAASTLLEMPYVARAEVTRSLPDSLHVKLSEHNPLGIVALEALYLFDEEGVLFKRLEPSDPEGLPVVTGISREALDQKGTCAQLVAAVRSLRALTRLGAFTRVEIAEVNIDKDLSTTLVLAPNGVRVSLGVIDEDGQGVAERLERLSRVVNVLQQKKLSATNIALDNNTRPERVAVQLVTKAKKPEPKPNEQN